MRGRSQKRKSLGLKKSRSVRGFRRDGSILKCSLYLVPVLYSFSNSLFWFLRDTRAYCLRVWISSHTWRVPMAHNQSICYRVTGGSGPLCVPSDRWFCFHFWSHKPRSHTVLSTRLPPPVMWLGRGVAALLFSFGLFSVSSGRLLIGRVPTTQSYLVARTTAIASFISRVPVCPQVMSKNRLNLLPGQALVMWPGRPSCTLQRSYWNANVSDPVCSPLWCVVCTGPSALCLGFLILRHELGKGLQPIWWPWSVGCSGGFRVCGGGLGPIVCFCLFFCYHNPLR